MKNHLFKRILSLLLVAALLVGYYVPGVQAASTGVSWKETDQKVKFDLSDRKIETHVDAGYSPSDIVRVSIVLKDKPTVQAGFPTRNIARNDQAMAYSRQLRAEQDALARKISSQVLGGQKLDVVWNLTLVGNIISANVPYGKIAAIQRVVGVQNVFVEKVYETCVVDRQENPANPQMFSSVNMVGSSQVWTNGYTGAGSRIAVIDTGTDTRHQSMNAGAFLYALRQNAAEKGISYAEYVKELDLLDVQEIASVLPDLKISQRFGNLSAQDLFLNDKLPFAVNYVDGNLTVDHRSDFQGEHGSHVAGIAAANRYIPKGDSYADAMDTVMMTGMAPDAQLITMKVFGNGNPSEADYMAAVEDAILLNCDAVNLSLGTPNAGSGFSNYYSDLLEYMTTTDTVVVASAGNSASWPIASLFGYLYSEDVNMDTVGSPGSYSSFFTVASVENDGLIAPAFRVAGKTMFYGEVTNYGNTPLGTLDTSANATGTEYDYVFIDGLGYPEDYAGMDLDGKIVFCSRGELNFAVKANNAMDLGAKAVIVYNNDDSGIFGMNLTGLEYARPCVSISMEDAQKVRGASEAKTTSGGLDYYTGKMTVMGKDVGSSFGSKYLLMSDFSS
jgi:lactocepin